MPSNLFEVRLEVDRALQYLLFANGVIVVPLGVLIVTMIDISRSLQFIAAFAWVFLMRRELTSASRSMHLLRSVVLDSSGQAQLIGPRRRILPVRLLAGSVILRRFAWLRFADAQGKAYSCMLLAARSDVDAWHRLQLLWRQSRGDFGHPAGA